MEKKTMMFLTEYEKFSALFSTVEFGNMKKNGKGSLDNRKSFVNSYASGCKFVFADVGHSGAVAMVGRHSRPIVEGVDALVSNDPQVALGVTGADCPPVYLLDPKIFVIGIIHASVHSVSAGIIANAVDAMFLLGADRIRAVIGPGICQNHYNVDFRYIRKLFPYSKFGRYLEQSKHNCDQIFVDLPGIIRYQLVNAGVRARDIQLSSVCTFGHRGQDGQPDLFSYRRMGRPDPVQAGLAMIYMK